MQIIGLGMESQIDFDYKFAVLFDTVNFHERFEMSGHNIIANLKSK
jgi:hypothetical protein